MQAADPVEAGVCRRSALLVSLLVLAILAWTGCAAFVLGDVGAYGEHGFLENCQAALLVLSTLVAVHAAATGCGADRPVLLLFAWTSIGMALRELDLDQFEAVPLWLARLGSGRGRTLVLAVGYAALGTFTALQWRQQGRSVFALLRRRPVRLLIVAALLLIIGHYFEKQTSLAQHVFLEEAAELVAFGLILQVAVRLWLNSRQRGPRVVARGIGVASMSSRRH
jgi:hypothetical protein